MINTVYIDFDGVILDTWKVISRHYILRYNTDNYEDDFIKKVMEDIGWNKILFESEIINDSISNINELSKLVNVCIITKFNSKDEKIQKQIYLQKKDINNVIFVPYVCNKSDYADAQNNILIDDTINNLDDWYKSGGIPIFFNKDSKNVDDFGKNNYKYKKIDDISHVYDIMKLYRRR